MGAASNYLESGILNWLFRSNSNNFTRPLEVAVALCTAVPSETQHGGNIPELPNANGYARVNLGPPANADWNEIAQNAQSSGLIDNAGAVTFPSATGDWGMVSGVAITDSGVYGAGNLLMYGKLTTARDVRNGDTFQFNTGELDIYLG